MATFYDALNAANLNALRMLDTQLKAQDDRNPVPSFLNTINERIRMKNAINANKERQDYYNQLKSGLYGNQSQQQAPMYNQGEGIGFNESGQYKIPAQQTMNPFGVDTSGWGNPSGNSINVGSFDTPKQNAWGSLFNQSFNQPPTDNPQAQAVEGQGTSPNYMSLMSNGQMTPQQQQAFDEKMNLRRWIEWDAQNNGVTNPLVALQRYQMFMEPMRQQAELDELRNAYYTFNDPKASDLDRRNAATLIEYAKKNPYMTEDHDMNTERFNWAKQNFENQQEAFAHQKSMWPFDIQGKQLGLLSKKQQLDANEMNLTGEYFGVNNEGKTWYRKNNSVDLSNLQPRAFAGLNHAADIFKNYFGGEQLMVTSGRDSDVHAPGEYSHYTGWKVDVSSPFGSSRLEDPQERAKFIQALNSVGIIVNDEWAKDKHLDLNFQNYRGNSVKNGASRQTRGQKPDLSFEEISTINQATPAFTQASDAKTQAATSKPIVQAYGNYYQRLALAVGGEQAARELYDMVNKQFPDVSPQAKDLIVRGAISSGVNGWQNGKEKQSTETDSTPKSTENLKDKVNNEAVREDNRPGYYVRYNPQTGKDEKISEDKMKAENNLDKTVSKIQPYEETQRQRLRDFVAEQTAAEERRKRIEEEEERRREEEERLYGI